MEGATAKVLDPSEASVLLSVWPEANLTSSSASLRLSHSPSGVAVTVTVGADVSCETDAKSNELRKLLLSYQGTLCGEIRALKAKLQVEEEEPLTIFLQVFEAFDKKFGMLIEEIIEASTDEVSPPLLPAVTTQGEGSVLSVMYSHHIIAKSKVRRPV